MSNWPAAWREQMARVNLAVNELPYVADAEQYKRDDFWTSIEDQGSGDCEDYAIAKLRTLLGLGWPLEALRLACCYTEGNEYHAVLVVDTPAKNISYMLDNRYPEPVDISKLKAEGYQPHIIQAVGGKSEWREWKLSGEG